MLNDLGNDTKSFVQSDFDFWLQDITKGRPTEFTEQAKQSNTFITNHFNSVHEYELWRFCQGFDDDMLVGSEFHCPDVDNSM